jgi:hypothetical protein
MKIIHISTLFLMIFSSLNLFSQDCSLTEVSTANVSQAGSNCVYQSVVAFSSSNSNSAVSVTVTINSGTINSVSNPGGQIDFTSPFTFTSSFVGNYTINYTVPCAQTGVIFTFDYNGPGNGDCVLSSPLIPLTPLPVEIVDLGYKKQNNDYLIHWTTASEDNNYGFHIEKSKDGIEFERTSFVHSANLPSGSAYNTIVDESDKYYRIVQEDYEGNQKAIGTIFIPSDKKISLKFSNDLVVIDNPNNTDYTFQIIDSKGAITMTKNANTGFILDISNLPSGVHYAKIVSNGEILSLPFVKL